jgi:hypothetical protein
MESVGTSTAAASRNGAARLKNARIRSHKYSPMQPWTQATVITASIIGIRHGAHIQYRNRICG